MIVQVKFSTKESELAAEYPLLNSCQGPTGGVWTVGEVTLIQSEVRKGTNGYTTDNYKHLFAGIF